MSHIHILLYFFFFNDTATTEIYTLSLHDALPISKSTMASPPSTPIGIVAINAPNLGEKPSRMATAAAIMRSEEHTSELQSLAYLVCRLLLEKKKKKEATHSPPSSECLVHTAGYAS